MKLPHKLRLNVIEAALKRIFSKPKYILFSILISFFMTGFMIWSLNFDLLYYVIATAPLSIIDKLDFFLYAYRSLFASYDNMLSMSMLLVSILFGINASLLVYAIRNYSASFRNSGKTSGAFALAFLGGGCIACGTSIITPFLSTLGVAVSTPFLQDLGIILNLVASLTLVYSISALSMSIAQNNPL